MLDIKLFRENPDIIKKNLKKKFQENKIPWVDEVVKLDNDWRKLKKQVDDLRSERNKLSMEVNKAKKANQDIKPILKKVKKIPKEISKKEKKMQELEEKITKHVMQIPNIVHDSVPIGKDDSKNKVIQVFGKPEKFDFEPKSHVELAESLDIADFETSAKVAGNGFFYLKGDLALLNQALLRFTVDFMTKKGYTLIEPPLMTRRRIVDGCVDMEFFNDMIYKIQDEDLYLIATSEHPLIGMFINQTLNEEQLPVKLCGISQCFRKEIGSHGIDEKGLFRNHQFNKVEQVIICKPEDSYKYYDELLNNSVELFKELGLSTRIFESCSGDLGDLKAKGADLEAWSPRKKGYIECCSVSNLTDAQARRLGIKVKKGSEKYFAHTLNNTALATSRAMVAILENFQNKDGSVTIPKALRHYMNGKKKIEKKAK